MTLAHILSGVVHGFQGTKLTGQRFFVAENARWKTGPVERETNPTDRDWKGKSLTSDTSFW